MQPKLPLCEQSTSCCSESERSSPVLMKWAPSMEPVVENDQQEPQEPWFLTPVTAPLATQSTESSSVGVKVPYSPPLRGSRARKPRVCWNSSSDQSENWLWPIVEVGF